MEFEPGLVPDIVPERRSRPGGLPLLLFALDRLWGRQSRERRPGNLDRAVLTSAAYRGHEGGGPGCSGIEAALDDHAEVDRERSSVTCLE